MATINKKQAEIKYINNKWVCTFKEKGELNFGFIGAGNNPIEAMKNLPYSGGINKNIKFHITIED